MLNSILRAMEWWNERWKTSRQVTWSNESVVNVWVENKTLRELGGNQVKQSEELELLTADTTLRYTLSKLVAMILLPQTREKTVKIIIKQFKLKWVPKGDGEMYHLAFDTYKDDVNF